MTGMHTVADIYCNVCNSVLGWKYVRDARRKRGCSLLVCLFAVFRPF